MASLDANQLVLFFAILFAILFAALYAILSLALSEKRSHRTIPSAASLN